MGLSTFNITVIIPVLNEEKNITPVVENTLKALDDYGINGEIIVVNDGSSDNTKRLVENLILKETRVKLINHEKPQGIGASYWDGVDASCGEIVTWIPGDNENDLWEIFRYYKLLKHIDIIIPFIFNKEVRSLFRNALSYAYRFIINTTFGVSFNYTNGTVLFRKSLLKELKRRNDSFFFQTDTLIRTVKKGYLFAEVPCRLKMRKEGISKAFSFPSLIKIIKGYLKLIKDFYFSNKQKETNHYVAGSQTAIRREKR